MIGLFFVLNLGDCLYLKKYQNRGGWVYTPKKFTLMDSAKKISREV